MNQPASINVVHLVFALFWFYKQSCGLQFHLSWKAIFSQTTIDTQFILSGYWHLFKLSNSIQRTCYDQLIA